MGYLEQRPAGVATTDDERLSLGPTGLPLFSFASRESALPPSLAFFSLAFSPSSFGHDGVRTCGHRRAVLSDSGGCPDDDR